MSAVTNQSIDMRIDTVTYHRLPGTTTTICAIKMVNGFTVLGQSACVNPADFDQELGESLAHDDAREKLWPLEGYLAAERRYQGLVADEHCHACKVEIYSIGQKMEWLLRQPIKNFSRFGAMLVSDCWCEIEGHIDLITRLPDGKLKCLHDLFYSMQKESA